MVDSVPRWGLSLSWPIQSDHLLIVDCDDTAFRAGTLTWQDPVHSWKAGPGEVMTVESFFKMCYLNLAWADSCWQSTGKPMKQKLWSSMYYYIFQPITKQFFLFKLVCHFLIGWNICKVFLWVSYYNGLSVKQNRTSFEAKSILVVAIWWWFWPQFGDIISYTVSPTVG